MAALLLLGTACERPAAEPSAAETLSAGDPLPNTLSEAEVRAGWRLLFDGRTTQGWRHFRRPDRPAGWRAVDGELQRVGRGGDIITVEQFTDFELKIDWKVEEGGNSGIVARERGMGPNLEDRAGDAGAG